MLRSLGQGRLDVVARPGPDDHDILEGHAPGVPIEQMGQQVAGCTLPDWYHILMAHVVSLYAASFCIIKDLIVW